jgi:uncharacterized protein (DUF433 family)
MIYNDNGTVTEGEPKMIGEGTYTLAEVSRFTEVHPSTVRTWFKGRPDGAARGSVFQSDYQPVGRDYAVSFLDMIDVLVAGQLRLRYQVPMWMVRRAHKVLQNELGTKHPFCHSDLYTDGRRIFISAASTLGEEKLHDVVSHQQFFVHIKEKLDRIVYSESTKLARQWRLAKGVILDPSISMGKPIIENTGVTTYVIANQYFANKEDAALVADLYEVTEKDIFNAVKFERIYGRRHVA